MSQTQEITELLGDSFEGRAPGGALPFLRPKEHLDAFALVIKVEKFLPDQPWKDRDTGETGTRNEVAASVQVFPTEQHLDAGEPLNLGAVKITHSVLAGDLEDHVGKIQVYRLAKSGRAFVWRGLEKPASLAKVRDFLIKQAEERQGALDALADDADVPEYLR